MTLGDIAQANKMSLEEFFAHCWRWKTNDRFAPTATIREDVRALNVQGHVPLYVAHYINQFNTAQTPN